MKNVQISFDETTVKILFSKYKLFFLPIGAIIISILLFFTLVVPQVQDFFSIESEINNTKQKIVVLQENVRLLSLVTDDKQNKDLQVVVDALPSEKDFVGIINAVSSSSQRAGVALDDFSFTVGNLTAAPAQGTTSPIIKLKLRMRGGIEGGQRFLQAIYASLPVSEIENISISGESIEMTVDFYYRSLPSFKIDFANKIPKFLKKEEELINTLSSWKTAGPIALSQKIPVATQSAQFSSKP